MSVSELLDDPVVQKEINEQVPWVKLPEAVKAKFGGNERSWKTLVIKWSLMHQLRWKTALVRRVVADERAYYQEVVKYSRDNLMLYPYHLSDVLIKGLQVTPFAFYREMMLAIMQKDESYDILPNFTAADSFRLLAIGRNEYINAMNASRTNRSFALFKKKENLLENQLPTHPVEISLQPWWVVNIGYVSEEHVRVCSAQEHATIDMLLDSGATPAGSMDHAVVLSLHSKGLIWLDVPITGDDFVTLTSLEGFVMNRVKGDFMERLLYKIFVTLDERTSIAQLAEVLQLPLEEVRMAVSMFVRLGFAERLAVPPVSSLHPSWTRPDIERGAKDASTEALLSAASSASAERRIGFLYDSGLTAFLMMGNLAEGLKSHAVTMYEVGKLDSASIESLLLVLDSLVLGHDEGEAKTYFEHAVTLRNVLRALWRKVKTIDGALLELDLLRAESLNALDRITRTRVLHKGYCVLVSMCPLGGREPPIEPGAGIPHYGPPTWEANSPWWKLFLASLVGPTGGAPATMLYRKGERVRTLPAAVGGGTAVRITKWDNETVMVASASALVMLNDMLLAAPVLVQASNGLTPETRHIPMPITEQDAALCPAVGVVTRELQLHTEMGYVEVQRSAEGQWLVYDVVYGVPLFNDSVAETVMQRMQDGQLLSPATLTAHVAHSAAVTTRLRQFIEECGALPFEAGTLTLPRREELT